MILLTLYLILFSNVIKCVDIDVKTTSGDVRGQTILILNQTVNQFLSIPYAEPPIGNLRFAKPKPMTKPIEKRIDATKPQNQCMQQNTDYKNSEDCLVLNIWSPQLTNALKPVMFWIHGGGLNAGTIFQSLYNGSVLATHDIVLVAANYRLGKFGFLYGGEESAPGNVGLYDQVLAIKWVRENIHLFGGDKNQITVFGESAGSRSISALIISPETKGLFRRVIMESGSIMHYKSREIQTKDELLVVSKEFAKRLNCTDDKWLQCLRTVDSKDINKIENIFTFPLEGTEFLPQSVQNALISGKYLQDIDILAGVTKNEGSLLAYLSFLRLRQKVPELTIKDFVVLVQEMNEIYHGLNTESVKAHFLSVKNSTDPNVLRQAFYDLFGDIHVKCPTYLFAKEFAKQTPKAKTYFYELLFQTKNIEKFGCDSKTMGICHGADIEFVFGQPLIHTNRYSLFEVEFSKTVMKLWTNFAKTGIPDPLWPEMIRNNSINANLLHPDFLIQTLRDPYPDSCDGFWKNYFN